MSIASAMIFGSVFWRMGMSQTSILDRMGLLQSLLEDETEDMYHAVEQSDLEFNSTKINSVEEDEQHAGAIQGSVKDIDESMSLDDPAASEPKNKTLENDRLITEIKTLKSRNDQLESDLIHQIDLKKECKRAKHTIKILEARYSMLEKNLENERKTLKAWTDSGKKVHETISKKHWKECLGYKDGIKDVDTENKIFLKTPVKFISSEADEPKSTFEKGSTSVSQEELVNDKTQRKKSKETIKSVKKKKNIGLLSAN
ncbi:hypothetical protein AgCh_019480 [Apium graveolens]